MRHEFSRPTGATFFGTPAEMREMAFTQGRECLPEGVTLLGNGTASRPASTQDHLFGPVAACSSCGSEHRHHDVFVTASNNVFGAGCPECHGRLDVCRWEER